MTDRINREKLRQKIFTDPDLPAEAGIFPPTPPPPSETKLSEALDTWKAAIIAPYLANKNVSWDAYAADIAAARSSLESLYREQALENERLRKAALTIEEACAIIEEDLTDRPSRSLAATSAIDKCIDVIEEHDAKIRISSKATSEEL